MGTDIHLYVEKLNSYEEPPTWELMMHEHVAWGRRSYNTFAVLADVRNGRGFAGVQTGEGFNVIAQPRDFPSDMSPEMQRHAANVEHTPSWLLLSEVLNFNWQQTTTHYGTVDAANYLAWERNGKPDCWSGGVGGPDVRHVSNEEMQALLPDDRTSIELPGNMETWCHDDWMPSLRRVYTQVSWRESYEDSCKSFLNWARGLVKPCGFYLNGEKLKEFKPGAVWEDGGPFQYDDPSHVRFVFWFDS